MADSFEQSMTYMEATAGQSLDAPGTTKERRAAYVTEGPKMIRFLVKNGIKLRRMAGEFQQQADELVREATAPLLTTEVQRAREVWQRKFGQVPLDMKERSRQVRFLMARGFTMHAIQKAIGGDTDGDTNDEDPGGAT